MGSPIAMSAPLALAADCSNATAAAAAQRTGGLAAAAQQAAAASRLLSATASPTRAPTTARAEAWRGERWGEQEHAVGGGRVGVRWRTRWDEGEME